MYVNIKQNKWLNNAFFYDDFCLICLMILYEKEKKNLNMEIVYIVQHKYMELIIWV